MFEKRDADNNIWICRGDGVVGWRKECPTEQIHNLPTNIRVIKSRKAGLKVG
jgi:hypothetical protein